MQIVYRYNLKPGRAAEYLEWLNKNDDVFRTQAPEGWSYVGTWFTVQGLGRHAAESRWELDDYATLGSGFGSEEYQRTLGEWIDFADPQDQETALMKSEDEVNVLPGS